MTSHKVRGLCAVALVLAACASPRGGSEGVADRAPADLASRFPPDCACTLEYRMNICVTVNGSETLPDSLSFVREREDGTRDALEYHPRCFGERVGTQRVLMLRDSAVIDSSAWFTVRTVDCCHGEAKTVDFTR